MLAREGGGPFGGGIVLAVPAVVLIAFVLTLGSAGARWRAWKRHNETTS